MVASIDSIESLGLVDGPGIRTVVFLNGCSLRCKYCHNPEMWTMGDKTMTVSELVSKILRNRPYFESSHGGVTFSGGEPLLQVDFLIEVCKRLKEYGIHIALDTAGVGIGKYEEILKYVDLVLLDIKHVNEDGYLELTGRSMDEFYEFLKDLNRSGKPVWIRQVIVPGIMDREEYLDSLVVFLKQIKNIERVDFLPYHKLGSEKYLELGLEYPYSDKEEMDPIECQKLYQKFLEKWKNQ